MLVRYRNACTWTILGRNRELRLSKHIAYVPADFGLKSIVKDNVSLSDSFSTSMVSETNGFSKFPYESRKFVESNIIQMQLM